MVIVVGGRVVQDGDSGIVDEVDTEVVDVGAVVLRGRPRP